MQQAVETAPLVGIRYCDLVTVFIVQEETFRSQEGDKDRVDQLQQHYDATSVQDLCIFSPLAKDINRIFEQVSVIGAKNVWRESKWQETRETSGA